MTFTNSFIFDHPWLFDSTKTEAQVPIVGNGWASFIFDFVKVVELSEQVFVLCALVHFPTISMEYFIGFKYGQNLYHYKFHNFKKYLSDPKQS